MASRLMAVATAALAAVVATATVFTQDAVDPAEMAVVEQIRARIEARQKDTAGQPAKAYTVTIPNTTFSYDMAAIPAGEFVMGSTAPDAQADEMPNHTVTLDAVWMQTPYVTLEIYLYVMFVDQAQEHMV